MKLQRHSFAIVNPLPLDRKMGLHMLKKIEEAGRTCYKSEDKMTDETSEAFVKMLIKRGHESVLEHQSLSVRFVCDRGVSHEIVRHRLCSFSQESTRYCNYSKDKFDNGIQVIEIAQHFSNPESLKYWETAMEQAQTMYLKLIELGESPQIARSVLPNSLKTEIVVTANLREWREVFRQRTAPGAHPQMKELMKPLLSFLKTVIPVVFDDIQSEETMQ